MKFIVLRVEDDSLADALVETLNAKPSLDLWEKTPADDVTPVPVPVDVVGLFKTPTNFCNPSDGHRGKKTDAGWTRGKKYGWWVCGACKKPTEAWGTNLNAVLSSARNLLAPSPQSLGAAKAVTSD
jgi:hypothetical protein